MKILNSILDRPAVRRWAGRVLLAGLVRLSVTGSKIIFDPPETQADLAKFEPGIFVTWHGQGTPSLKILAPEPARVAVLVSTHQDGLIMSSAARALGLSVIEVADATKPKGGGARALREMIRAVNGGTSMILTADIPPIPGRRVSDGMAMLARATGQPIIPFAISSSRRITLKNWDQMQFNLPFSRLVVALGEPIYVAKDDHDLGTVSKNLGQVLDECLARAIRLADEG